MDLDRKRVLKFVLRDAIVILIGVPLVLAAVIFYAEVGPLSWMPSVRWWGLAAMSCLLLSFVARQYRRAWRQRSFWVIVSLVTVLHLTGWSIVLAKAEVWGLLWFLPPITLEGALLVLLFDKLGYGWSS